MKKLAHLDNKLYAIIDIGSNSVRLVIYKIFKDAFISVHNEKVLAGLGGGVKTTNRLPEAGKEMAIKALKRFKLVIDNFGNIPYIAICTAAMRIAEDGVDFIREINEEIGLKARIISGEEEGRLSAKGLRFGAPDSIGFMGDLGGSSVEFVNLDNANPISESWELGPLSLGEFSKHEFLTENKEKTIDIIDNILEQSNVLKLNDLEEFHAIGGSWRALGNIDIALNNYPLKILHNYETSAENALKTCDFILTQTKKVLEKLGNISTERVESVAYGALLLSRILKKSNCKRLVISSYGLREGVLSQEIIGEEENYRPLINGAAAIADLDNKDLEFSIALHSWLSNINEFISKNYSIKRFDTLIETACLLSNIGVTLHPDYRASLAYDIVLAAPYPAASHKERVFLARTISRRYGAKNSDILKSACSQLLNEYKMQIADIYGAAIRLGCNLSGNSEALLSSVKLIIKDNEAILNWERNSDILFSTTVEKRLKKLNELIVGLNLKFNDNCGNESPYLL